MTGRAQKALMATAMSLSAMGVAQAQVAPPVSEPIRVGIIDTDASAMADEKRGVTVHTRSFIEANQRPASHRTQSGREHGADVIASFADQSWRIDPTRRIEVFSAQAFFRKGDEQIDEMKNRPMGINMAAAHRALDWFKENGVRVVITPFIMPEGKGINGFMEKASSLGIVVFASTNNVTAGFDPFPARHPDAISVAGTGSNLDLARESVKGWVSFQADSGIPGKSLTVTPENGASFAAGRVAAFGAHMVDRDPRIPRSEIVDQLKGLASNGGIPSLAGRDPIVRVRTSFGMPDADRVALPINGPSKPSVDFRLRPAPAGPAVVAAVAAQALAR